MASVADIERAVGKLITGKVSGSALDDEVVSAITSGAFAGVTLFKEEGLLSQEGGIRTIFT